MKFVYRLYFIRSVVTGKLCILFTVEYKKEISNLELSQSTMDHQLLWLLAQGVCGGGHCVSTCTTATFTTANIT